MGEFDRWSNIHEDLLNEISKRFYSYDDRYIQLGLICKQWNLKLPKIPDGNKVPLLLLPIPGCAAKESFEEEARTLENEKVLDTCSLEEKGIYHLMFPDIQDNVICGSCHGWLIMVIVSEGTIRMLNPFTKVHLDLPPISALPNLINIDGWDEWTIARNTISMGKFEVWKAIINCAPINNNDFTAVLVIGLNSSVQILSTNFLNCKGNKIYYTDDIRAVLSVRAGYSAPRYEIGIFNLEDGSYQTFLDFNKDELFFDPIWILP